MTSRDNIIKLAKEHGLWVPGFPTEHVEAFFHAAQKLEREECAQLMEEQDTQAPKHNAKAIRNRSAT